VKILVDITNKLLTDVRSEKSMLICATLSMNVCDVLRMFESRVSEALTTSVVQVELSVQLCESVCVCVSRQ